jgi:hypothetical protein
MNWKRFDEDDAIDPQAWGDAVDASRDYVGMGDIKVLWNPYEHIWIVTINFSNNVPYTAENRSLSEALRVATKMLRESPPLTDPRYHPEGER